MRKKCAVCGRFMHEKLHGACLGCLRNGKRLPEHLKKLKESYDDGKFQGDYKKSVRGIINAASTLIVDKDWYAVKWNPVGNLRKVLDTKDERPYLKEEVIEELEAILESLND